MFKTGDKVGSLEIQQQIGKGGMATVYKVWHHDMHRHEALKLPHSQNAHDEQGQRFMAEVRHTANFNHPHIATIYNVYTGAGQYFTMEYVGGGDLADVIHERGSLSLEETCELLGQVASALDYAHAKGVLHRDVKPANILLNRIEDGKCEAKVVDFGISWAQESEPGARLTKTGMFIGTPEYMSPEQAGNGMVVDGRTDQYALGIIAYEMLCGEPPFKAEGDTSYLSIVIKHARDEPQPLLERVPSLPVAANDVVMRVLSKDPAHRFGSCSEFIAALTATIPRPTPLVLPKEAKGLGESNLLRNLLIGAMGLGVLLILASIVFRGQETTVAKAPGAGNKPTPTPTVVATPSPTATPTPVPQPVTGTYTFNDKSTYRGELLNGKPHGTGIKTRSDKSRVEAEWANGKIMRVIRELPYNGTLNRADGSTYHGWLLGGKMHGKGKLTRPTRVELSGLFQNNQPSGEILLKYKSKTPERISPWTQAGENEVWNRWRPKQQTPRHHDGSSGRRKGGDSIKKKGGGGNSSSNNSGARTGREKIHRERREADVPPSR